MSENVELSSLGIIYSVILFLIGIFFLMKDRRNPHRQADLVRPSRSSWLDFGILIWALVTIMYVVPRTLAFFSGQLSPDWQMVAPSFFIQLAVLLFIWLSLKKFPNLFDSPINLAGSSFIRSALEGGRLFLCAIPIVWFVSFFWIQTLKILGKMGIEIPISHQDLVTLFASSKSSLFLLTVAFFGIVIAPITEEFIFRVALYRFLKGRVGRLVAITLSALLFAWVHYNIMSFVPLFVLGLLLARAYERTGNVTTNIVFHGLFNANTFLLLLLNPHLTLLT